MCLQWVSQDGLFYSVRLREEAWLAYGSPWKLDVSESWGGGPGGCICAVTALIILCAWSLMLKDHLYVFIKCNLNHQKGTKSLFSIEQKKAKFIFWWHLSSNVTAEYRLGASGQQFVFLSPWGASEGVVPPLRRRQSVSKCLSSSAHEPCFHKTVHPVRINCPPNPPNFPWKDTKGRWRWNCAPRASWKHELVKGEQFTILLNMKWLWFT